MVGPLTKLLKRLEHGRYEGAAGLEAAPNVWQLLVKAPTAAGRPPITSRNSVLDDADRRAEEIRRCGVAEARSVIARAERQAELIIERRMAEARAVEESARAAIRGELEAPKRKPARRTKPELVSGLTVCARCEGVIGRSAPACQWCGARLARARRADLVRRPLARRQVRLRLMMTDLTSRQEPPGREQSWAPTGVNA